MKIFGYICAGIVSLILIIVILIGLGLFQLEWMKFFNPKKEEIRREVYEQTQSYTHGKAQELAKYYEEYTKAKTTEDKELIKNLIQFKFAEFDQSTLNSEKLKTFLSNMRGY